MKSGHRKVFILFVILLLIPILWQSFKYVLTREIFLSQIRIYVTKSRKHNWEAIFISHGAMMVHTITLAVVSEPERRGTEVVVGDVKYEDIRPDIYHFCWSADETVIAVLTNATTGEVEVEPYTELCYTHAYDFLKNEVIGPPEKEPEADDPNIWNKNAKQIKTLLYERGGAGKIIDYQNMLFKRPNRKERRQWESVLKKARDKKQ